MTSEIKPRKKLVVGAGALSIDDAKRLFTFFPKSLQQEIAKAALTREAHAKRLDVPFDDSERARTFVELVCEVTLGRGSELLAAGGTDAYAYEARRYGVYQMPPIDFR
jgi:hypothetical protein